MDKFIRALEEATVSDVKFERQNVSSHPDSGETKIGYRPVSIKGVMVPDPNLVVYICSKSKNAKYWYVLNWSHAKTSGRPMGLNFDSEQEARLAVLDGLKTAYYQDKSLQ